MLFKKRLVEPGNEGMWKYVKCAGLTVIIVLVLLVVVTVNTGNTFSKKHSKTQILK